MVLFVCLSEGCLFCGAASPRMCARSGASTPRLNGASRCPYRGFGGRRSSRNRACFGLHPLKRGTRLVSRYGRTVCTISRACHRPSASDRLFLPSCSPPSPRHGASVVHLATARGAVTRQFRFSRRDARNGRRTSRLCTVASDLRLLIPASSTPSVLPGGIPPWTRHELLW